MKKNIITIVALVVIIVVMVLVVKALKAEPLNLMPLQMGKLPADSTPPPSQESIVGITWVWKHTVTEGDMVTVPKNANVFSFTLMNDGSLRGTTDCNGFGGNYEFGSEGAIMFTDFVSTQMYCEGSQESEFINDMAKAVRVTTDNEGRLIVLLGSGTDQMVFEKK